MAANLSIAPPRFLLLSRRQALQNGTGGSKCSKRGCEAASKGDGSMTHLEKELALRTAAMENLQQQLYHVESLRAEELRTAIARFEELEEALKLAEKSISAEEKRVQQLESEVEMKDKEIKDAVSRIMKLEDEIERVEKSDSVQVEELKRSLEAARKEVEESQIRESALRDAAARELEASQRLYEMARSAATLVEEQLAAKLERDDAGGVGMTGPSLNGATTVDLEVLLSELDLLRGELEAELQASETAMERAAAAEHELAELKASIEGNDVLSEERGEVQSMILELQQEVETYRSKCMASAAECAELKIALANLEGQLEELRVQQVGSQTTSTSKDSRQQKQREDILKYVHELEQRNQFLSGELKAIERAMAESRSFLKSTASHVVASPATE